MEEPSIYDYSSTVHRALLEPNLMLGIGITPAMLIIIVTIILMNLVSVWCIFAGIILFIVAKMICRNDPYALTILFERLAVPDLWRAD